MIRDLIRRFFDPLAPVSDPAPPVSSAEPPPPVPPASPASPVSSAAPAPPVPPARARRAPAPDAPEGTKVCLRCGQERPLSDYWRMSRYRDGYRPTCKACVALDRASAQEREPEVTHRTCSRCGRELPVEHYHLDSSKRTGRRPSCRDCDRLVRGTAAEGASADRRSKRERREAEVADALARGAKVCAVCGQERLLTSFPIRRAAPDGRAKTCSSCAQVSRGGDPSDADRVARWKARQEEVALLVHRRE